MKLTKLQRHTAYIIMLEESESFYHTGFCWMIYYLFDIGVGCYDSSIEQFLPELYDKKPNTYGAFWFDANRLGWQERIELLKQCINETA